jgi:hypothetical protein
MYLNAFMLMLGDRILLNEQKYGDVYLCAEPSNQDACELLLKPKWSAEGPTWTLTAVRDGERGVVLTVAWRTSSDGTATWSGRQGEVTVGTQRGFVEPPTIEDELGSPSAWHIRSNNRVYWRDVLVPGFWQLTDDCVADNGDLKYFVQLDLSLKHDQAQYEGPITLERSGRVSIPRGGIAAGNCPGDKGPKRAIFGPGL